MLELIISVQSMWSNKIHGCKNEIFRKSIDKLSVYEGFDLTGYDEIKGNSLYEMYKVLLKNKSKQKQTRVRPHYNSLLFLIVESIDKEKKEEIKKAIIKSDPELNELNKISSRDADLIAQREFIVMLRELLLLTVNGIQMIGLWSECLDEYPPEDGQIITRNNSDEFLYDLVKKFGKEIPDDLVEIEKKYKLVSVIKTLFSKKYSIDKAYYTSNLYLKKYLLHLLKNWQLYRNKFPRPIKTMIENVVPLIAFVLALIRTFFSMPLFFGLLVGWIYILSTEEAIRYILKNILMSTEISMITTTFVVFSAISFFNYLFIYIAGPRDDISVMNRFVRGLYILLGVTLLSVGIGWFLLYKPYAQQWLEGIVNNTSTTVEPPVLISTEQLICFIGIWSSMAVFIGIFTQIIWSGRGPTEIND